MTVALPADSCAGEERPYMGRVIVRILEQAAMARDRSVGDDRGLWLIHAPVYLDGVCITSTARKRTSARIIRS